MSVSRIAHAVDSKMEKVPVAEKSPRPELSPVETMRAVTWQGKRSVACETVPRPLITHPKDVIVKVTACTICSGSDSHVYAGEIPGVEKGMILGHESCGVVYEKGKEVTKFDIGDRVVVAFDIACGECDYCQRKEFTGCDRTNDSKLMEEMYGHRHSAMFGYGSLLADVPGSQAEYVRVPFADVNCYPIPDDVPDEKALYLSDVVCTSLHANVLAEIKDGDTVAIWGLGPIGLASARWAQILGCKRIVGIDYVPERLELAREKLGIDVIDRNVHEDVVKAVHELIPNGPDAVIDATGFRFTTTTRHKIERALGMETDSPDIIRECFKSVRKWGRVSIIADYVFVANEFPVGYIMMKHLTVKSGQCPCQRYFERAMKHVQQGDFDPTFFVTNTITLEDAPMAYDKLFYKKDGWIKVFIRP